MLYRAIFEFALSRLDAEQAHEKVLSLLDRLGRRPLALDRLQRRYRRSDPRLSCSIAGLDFAHPLGLAAGWDKDARAVDALMALGFSHIEVGTVCLRPQPGNPKPRMWRAKKQRALINALGFPSQGVEPVVVRLSRPRSLPAIVGVNIGKNRSTPLEAAAADYRALAVLLAPVADYFTINVSSPNTPGLRDLQRVEQLVELIDAVQAIWRTTAALPKRPIFVKLAPDLDDIELVEIAKLCLERRVDGIVATNTTIDRQWIPAQLAAHPGGVSGAPLRARAEAVVRLLYRATDGKLPIIGVGGIASAEDVVRRVRLGARLVQAYSGFIYGGPGFVRQVITDLGKIADRQGWCRLEEILGADA